MHRTTKILIGCGAALCAAAAAWGPVVVPRVVKLPAGVDRTDRYEGTFVTFLDAATGAALPTPREEPLVIERRVASVPGETGARVALLEETATAQMGDRTVIQRNVYAVDRRTMENVADDRAWTFRPGNVVDRSGTYYLTLPMGVGETGETFSVWKPETGSSYEIISGDPAIGKAGGIGVVYLEGSFPAPVPVAPYEVVALEAQGLPMELSPEQAAAQLEAAGVDVAALAPVLMAGLSAEEFETVAAAMRSPMPLRYFVYGSGRLAVEPATGGLVELAGIVDGVAVAPDMSSMADVVSVLELHAEVPAIAALLGTLEEMAAVPPQPVYELRYSQTPASVATAAAYAADQADRMKLATSTIPRTVGTAGAVALVAAVLSLRGRARRQPEAAVLRIPPARPKAA